MSLFDQPETQFPLDDPDGKALWEGLAKLYPDNDRVKILCRLAGLAVQEIDFSRPASKFWVDVLDKAVRTEKLRTLLDRIAEDPESLFIRQLLRRLLAEPTGDGEERPTAPLRPGPQEERRAAARVGLRGERGLVFIGMSATRRPAGKLEADLHDDPRQRKPSKTYLGELVSGDPGHPRHQAHGGIEQTLRDMGYGVWIDSDAADATGYRANYGLLTCDIAVLLLDRDALASRYFADQVPVLLWLRGLGVPVLPVALGRVTPEEIRDSPLGGILSGQRADVLTFPNHRQSGDAPATHVAMICEKVAGLLPARPRPSPAARWITDMAGFLEKVPDDAIRLYAAELGVPLHDPGQPYSPRPDNPREAVAAAIFGSNANQVFEHLRDAIKRYLYPDVETSEKVVNRAEPIWVDLDTARLVLEVAELPSGLRVCGFETTTVRHGRHIVERATASDPGYEPVGPPEAVGEDAGEELLKRYDSSLRGALGLLDSDSPETIGQQLAEYPATVFALVNCRGMNPGVAHNLLTRLGQRFPGIAFVLLAEADSPVWKSVPEARRSGRPWSNDDDHEAQRYVRRLYQLIGKNVPGYGDVQHGR
jgi:hypothetical protein